MSETALYLCFLGLMWGAGIGAFAWIRWKYYADFKRRREQQQLSSIEPDHPWPRK